MIFGAKRCEELSVRTTALIMEKGIAQGRAEEQVVTIDKLNFEVCVCVGVCVYAYIFLCVCVCMCVHVFLFCVCIYYVNTVVLEGFLLVKLAV